MNFDIVYAKQIKDKLDNPMTKLVDIRSESLYKECHLEKAINLPFYTTDNYENEIDMKYYYIFYCQSGGSSMKLARYLGKKGFRTATVIGGFLAASEYLKKVGLCDKI